MPAASAVERSLRDFRAVYVEHHGLVWHALHRFGVASALIDDAVQDVFVVAYRRRADFAGGSIKAWLYGITRRVASNYRRSDQRRTLRVRAARSTARRRSSMSGDLHETIGAIGSCLASLPASDRELFILSEIEGMTGPEIALACGRNVQTIYTRIRKVRQQVHASVELIDDARRARPRATAGSWALLVPWLEASPAPLVLATGWGGVLGSSWGVAVLATTIVVGLLAASRTVPRVGDRSPAMVGLERESTAPSARTAPATPRTAEPVAAEPEAPAPEAPAPIVRPPARGTTAATQGPSTGGSHGASRSDAQLSVENDLLRGAADELRRGAPNDTLRITSEHARRFPRSSLADLRAALRIEALCALDKAAQARGEAHVFSREHAGSPLSQRIEKSCAGRSYNSTVPDNQGT